MNGLISSLITKPGQQNDTIKARYTVANPEKFAVLKVQLTGSDPTKRYIVQQLDASGKMKQEKYDITTQSGVVQFNYVQTGEIQVRLVEDANGNGKWDTGNIVERRQPERTELYINEEGESLFATKANWEIELTIDVDKLFAPVTMQSLQQMLDERELQRLAREEEKRAKEGKKKNNDGHNHGSMGFGGMGGTSAMQSTGDMFQRHR